MSTLNKGEGFLLLSTGDDRKQWLFNLIESIQTTYPGAPIHVLTDAPVDVPHTLISNAEGFDSRYYKTRLFYYTPFETTIFLDDDTLVRAPFGSLNDLLREKSIGMARDPFATLGLWRDNIIRHCLGANTAWDGFVKYVDESIENCPFYNSGVIVWRQTDPIRHLFDEWHDLWFHEGKGPDQTWLAIALLELAIQIEDLPLELNFYPVTEHCRGHKKYPRLQEAKIIHFLSPFGKSKMSQLAPHNAPAHLAYLRHKDSTNDSKRDQWEAANNKGGVDLVVARYNEDLAWILEVPINIRIIVYNKGGEIIDTNVLKRISLVENRPNFGRETDSYIRHIRTKRSNLTERTIFTQGDPFPHSPDFIELLGSIENWEAIQGLSLGWLERCRIPPPSILEIDRDDWIDNFRIRREVYSLKTWAPLSFIDGGITNIYREYLSWHSLPEGTNIAEHFLKLAGWQDLASLAGGAEIGIFSYAAIFSVQSSLLQNIPISVLDRIETLSSSHRTHGYICERLWLHFFGLPFLSFDKNVVH